MDKSTKRRQNHACDQCRKSKRACDTRLFPAARNYRTSMYPGPYQAPDLTRSPSCSYCLKTKKKCTFVWAQAQLRSANKASPSADSTDRNEPTGATPQFYDQALGYDAGFVSPQGESDHNVGIGPADVPDMFNNLKHSPSAALNLDLQQQLDMFATAPLDINTIPPYSSPASNSTDGKWISSAGTSLDPGQQAFWGSLPNLSSDETQSFSSPQESLLSGTEWFGQDSLIPNIDSDVNSLYQKRDSKQDSPSSWTDWSAPSSALSIVSTQDQMLNISNNLMISENLLRIYHDVLEHNLSCWLAEETCPYGGMSLTFARASPNGGMQNELGSTWSNKVYSRVKRLDRVAQRNRLLKLRLSEDQDASKALDLVIMAFASQWAQGSHRQREKYSTSPEEHGTNQQGLTTPPPEEFDRFIQRQLWGQAKTALETVSGLECFRVVCAELIFGLCQRPLDDEDTSSTWDSVGQGDNPSTILETLMCRLREAVENDDPPIFMERAARKIHALKCKFEAWEAGWLDKTNSQNIPGWVSGNMDTEIKEGKRTVQILYWFAVMFDTISSSMNERPVVVADEESQHDAAWDMTRLGAAIDEYGEGDGLLSQRWHIQLFIQDDPAKPSQIPPWPLPYDEAALIVTKSAPVKVLLFRHVSYLQSTIRRGRRGKAVEDIISAGMVLYKYWNVTYGPFYRTMIRDYDNVPPRIQSWFICLWSHWHLAVLLFADLIGFVDKKNLGIEEMCRRRANSDFSRQIAKNSALEVSDIAAVAAPKDEHKASSNASQWSPPPGAMQDPSFHTTFHEGAILTEPWTVLIIRAFTKAAAIHLERSEELWHSRLPDPSGRRDQLQESLSRCEDCTRGLWLLGKKSDMARKAAEILSRAHSEMSNQISVESMMVPPESWEGILSWIST